MEKTVWQQRHGSVIFSGRSAGIMIFPANWISILFRKRKRSLFMMPSNREPLPVFLIRRRLVSYLVKKIYLGAEEGQLMGIAQLCLDEASFSKVAAEQPGVPDIRKRAFEEILERDFGRLNASFAGRLKLAYLRRALTGDPAGEQKLRRELDRVEALKDTNDTLEIIRCVDGIYNSAVDRKFESRSMGLWRRCWQFPWQI